MAITVVTSEDLVVDVSPPAENVITVETGNATSQAGVTLLFDTNKATLVDADKICILDSAASSLPKHSLFSLVKSTLLTYFSTLFPTRANNLSDLASASTARTNLSLGTAATTDTGTGASNTILGNDARLTDARTPTAHASTHGLGGSDPMAPGDIGAAYQPDSAKATALVDADKFYIYDSANSLAPRTSLWSIIKSTLKTYFDTLYPSGSGTSIGANTGDQTSIVGITGSLADFNAALTGADFATLAGSETLTNKTLTSPILTTPALGTPASGALTNCTSIPAAQLTGDVAVARIATALTTPGAIGGNTPSAGTFTALTAPTVTSTSTLTLTSAASNNLQLTAGSGAVVSIKNATPTFRLEDTDLSNIPNYSAVGFNPALTTSTVGQVGFASSTGGGLDLTGFGTSAAGATGFALLFSGYSGKTSPTVAPTQFYVFKHNGTTGATALAASEKCYEFFNSGTLLITVFGNGNTAFVGAVTITGNLTANGAFISVPQALSGAGAVNITTRNTKLTTTGAAQALTLADGTDGQEKTIIHEVDGGSAVLTPTTKTGFTTITFTNVGDAVTLIFFTTRGWMVKSLYGAVAA